MPCAGAPRRARASGAAAARATAATRRGLLLADVGRRDLLGRGLVDNPEVEITEDEAAAVGGVDPVVPAGRDRERDVLGRDVAVEGRIAVEVPDREAVLARRDAHA